MKRKPPSGISALWSKILRFFRKKTIGLKDSPGYQPCWSCKLYDTNLHACTILVDRGKYAPKDESGRKITELRRVWPFDICVRLPDMELGRIIILDKDSPEHASGKKQIQQMEEEARRRKQNDDDQKLLDLIRGFDNKKKPGRSVSNRESDQRGDPWLSSNANDAGGLPPTKRN